MFETEFCKIAYLEDHNAVLCRWKKFCSFENYRTPLEYGLQLINEKEASMWITDTTNGFESVPEDTQWLIEAFMPKVIGSACRTITFIIQEESPLKEEIEQQEKALSRYFKVQKAEYLEEIIA
jgi:hypothetical protein